MTVNPDDFIISRKRKKYRFARFANASNCYEYDEWLAQRPLAANRKGQASAIAKSDDFAAPSSEVDRRGLALATTPVTVELGAGTGLFSVEQAARHSDELFVAVDVKADRLQKGAYEALERGLKNVLFVRARADQLHELFAPSSLSAIWLTFPDPFPKRRSAGRRMTHPNFLRNYATLLTTGSTRNGGGSGALYLKHDNREFFCWSLEQLVAGKWQIGELSFDLHDSELSDDYKTLTTYERRWLSEGLTTNFVKAQR